MFAANPADSLGRLKTEGMIISRQGAGSFVRDRAATTLGFSPVETIADIQRCYEFRLTIEPDAAFPPQTAATRRHFAKWSRLSNCS